MCDHQECLLAYTKRKQTAGYVGLGLQGTVTVTEVTESRREKKKSRNWNNKADK